MFNLNIIHLPLDWTPIQNLSRTNLAVSSARHLTGVMVSVSFPHFPLCFLQRSLMKFLFNRRLIYSHIYPSSVSNWSETNQRFRFTFMDLQVGGLVPGRTSGTIQVVFFPAAVEFRCARGRPCACSVPSCFTLVGWTLNLVPTDWKQLCQ